MNNIIDAIEGYNWDFEDGFNVPWIIQVNLPHLLMRKNEKSSSIYSNKVMRSIFHNNIEQEIENVLNFFRDIPFSWWIGPLSKPSNLKEILIEREFKEVDKYVGLAFNIFDWTETNLKSNYRIVDTEKEKNLLEHVKVSAKVWEIDDKSSIESIYEMRKKYLQIPDRRGGFIVALDNEKGVGNASYRLSHDKKVMYLIGSGVLPEYRNQGIYHDLLYYRFKIALQNNVEWITVIARVGTSEPILRKIGFKEYGNYIVLSKS